MFLLKIYGVFGEKVGDFCVVELLSFVCKIFFVYGFNNIYICNNGIVVLKTMFSISETNRKITVYFY